MLLEERVARSTTEAEAVELARELYGLSVSAKALPGEYDDNFHLTPRDGAGAQPRLAAPLSNRLHTKNEPAGEEFVLKVMHPAREGSFIDMQCRALQHLAERAPQLTLPRVILNRRGEAVAAVQADGTARLVWLLTYVPGTMLVKARPHSAELLQSLGQFLGTLDAALADFEHPAVRRELKWDLARAGWIREHLHLIRDGSQRALVEKFLVLYDAEVVPVLAQLRRSVVYGDANDYNVLIGPPLPLPRKIVSVIDFGDMHETVTISEVAIAAAYAILGKGDPLRAAADVVVGYHRTFPLTEAELRILHLLIGTRLAVSVVNSAQRASVKPGDAYVTVSERPAWEALERLAKIHPRFAHYTFREACGFVAVPQSEALRKWLVDNAASAASVLDADLRTAPSVVFDFSVGSTFLGADPAAGDPSVLSERTFAEMKRTGASVGIGRYNEARSLYTSALFGSNGKPTDERRTVHLGIDLQVAPGSAVRAQLDGVVHAFANNKEPLDYGPVVILRHAVPNNAGGAQEFFTLYGHLSASTLEKLRVGQEITRGEKFAEVGATSENGGWAPHLHFQIITDLLEYGTDFPGVARASERGVWTSLSPDPNLLLGIPAERFPHQPDSVEETLRARGALLGKNLSVSYRRPLKIVRGWMQYLYDDTGRAYLDVYNNVPLVGHSHPCVVRAAQKQLALLNTNTRYLHDNAIRYAQRLTELMPQPLCVCYFVNSGSEANELALRMARAHTRCEDVIVLEHAYHGHTNTLIDISPYKFDGPGGRGKKPWVHVAPLADDYHGPYRRGDVQAGAKFASHVAEILEGIRAEGRDIAAYIAETLPSVGGQIVFPPDYLAE